MNRQQTVSSVIQNLEELLLSPEIRSNKDKLDLLLADDFVEFGASGNVFTKSSIIDSLINSGEDWYYNLDDFICKAMADDVFLVTYKLNIFSQDNFMLRQSIRSSIWQNRSQNWQIIFHQGTNVGH